MDISAEQRRRGFNAWLRTGRWSPSGATGAREVKFNPWHDPDDGRFTFANTGRYYGRAAARQSASSGRTASKIVYAEDDRLPPIATLEEVEAWRARELAKHGHKPEHRRAIEEQYRRYLDKLAGRQVPTRRLATSPMPPHAPLQARTFVHERKVVSPANAAALVGVARTALGTLLRRNPLKGRVAVQRVEPPSAAAEAASVAAARAELGTLLPRGLGRSSRVVRSAEADLAASVFMMKTRRTRDERVRRTPSEDKGGELRRRARNRRQVGNGLLATDINLKLKSRTEHAA